MRGISSMVKVEIIDENDTFLSLIKIYKNDNEVQEIYLPTWIVDMTKERIQAGKINLTEAVKRTGIKEHNI